MWAALSLLLVLLKLLALLGVLPNVATERVGLIRAPVNATTGISHLYASSSNAFFGCSSAPPKECEWTVSGFCV